MKIINQSWNFIDEIDGLEILKKLERIGRVSYKSEDKITEDSAAKFVKMLIDSGHESTIEHVSLTVHIITDRGVSHELVRHRIASFTQECISGSSELLPGFTIKELYNRRHSLQNLSFRSISQNGIVIKNKIVDVFYKGIQPVYTITTKLGYSLKSTLEHKFLTEKGIYSRLKDLSVNNIVMVNGRPCLLQIDDDTLVKEYLENKLSPQEIANKFKADRVNVIGVMQFDMTNFHGADKDIYLVHSHPHGCGKHKNRYFLKPRMSKIILGVEAISVF